jgi:3-methyladenine DNA glycosylase AlkD
MKNREKMSRTALRYAIEKLPNNIKEKVMAK